MPLPAVLCRAPVKGRAHLADEGQHDPQTLRRLGNIPERMDYAIGLSLKRPTACSSCGYR
jgi:hypothetical protein